MNDEVNITAPQHNRRDWLRRVGLGGAAAAIGAMLPGSGSIARAVTPGTRKRALRVAHLTDVHVQPERGAAEGFEACLHHVQSQADKPDLIVFTGDNIFDAFAQTRDRTRMLWDLWSRVLKSECSVPVLPLLGNHDIWGWNKAKSGASGNEPDYGKRWACDALGLDRPYYSVDRGNWHVVLLDSVQPWEDRKYTAHLDEAQHDWLASDLAANAGKPTLICSHIPILSITPIMNQKPEVGRGKNGEANSVLEHGGMHTDWRELRAMFKRHRDVKLAISGHIHLNDRVDYDGVSYCCSHAVSGGWWKQAHIGEGDACYTMFDLYDDGSYDRQSVNYGWAYRDEPATKPVAPIAN